MAPAERDGHSLSGQVRVSSATRLIRGRHHHHSEPFDLLVHSDCQKGEVPDSQKCGLAQNLMSAPADNAVSEPPVIITVRGQAYLASRQRTNAVGAFSRTVLDHPGIVLNNPIGALAHLQLACAYVMEGNTNRARSRYQDFLSLWKDADPDIPILEQAKAEYAIAAIKIFSPHFLYPPSRAARRKARQGSKVI